MRLEIEIPDDLADAVRTWAKGMTSRYVRDPEALQDWCQALAPAVHVAWPVPKCGANQAVSAWGVMVACGLVEGHEGEHSQTSGAVTVTWSDRCPAILQDGDRDVSCALLAGHEGQHRNGLAGKMWTDALGLSCGAPHPVRDGVVCALSAGHVGQHRGPTPRSVHGIAAWTTWDSHDDPDPDQCGAPPETCGEWFADYGEEAAYCTLPAGHDGPHGD